ncbi:MAG: site-specific DNA-methyltransferase [Candidatus Brocadiales bacterium]|nr:site-specific DNA-methyltransferase [Candidatus Bathyanammoxibius sp.]
MILQGDVLDKLAEIDTESVHCVVTSPPYWGLRNYNLPPQVWDDSGGCEHEWGPDITAQKRGARGDKSKSTLDGRKPVDGDDRILKLQQGQFCHLCNAWRGSLGLEPTPELYLQHMVEVFRKVRRVLRKDGTVWLNMGDSYWGGGGGNYGGNQKSVKGREGSHITNVKNRYNPPGLKPKDLCGIPWRLALALQNDGWWLRSDIIWAKPNPMPESVTDRPTRSHEYVFLLTKSARYFYDTEAVRERYSEASLADPRDNKDGHRRERDYPGQQSVGGTNLGGNRAAGRNLRSVWNIATQPFLGAHFATFPEKLVVRCIVAGTSAKGCCPECGAPWERSTKPSDRYQAVLGEGYHDHSADLEKGMKSVRGANKQNKIRDAGISGKELVTLGWRPTCECGGEPVPAVVLDPFLGSGTVGKVAQDLGRAGIGIELNPDYCEMARERTRHPQELLRLG